MGIQELLASKKKEILSVAAKHGASNIRIFGSVARGEASEQSDIDLLVEIEPDRTLLDYISLRQDLELLLARKVDLAEAENLHKLIREQVLKEAVPL